MVDTAREVVTEVIAATAVEIAVTAVENAVTVEETEATAVREAAVVTITAAKRADEKVQ